jgi:hypothetical protein
MSGASQGGSGAFQKIKISSFGFDLRNQEASWNESFGMMEN